MSKLQNASRPLSPPQEARIRETLDRVAASPAFRKSEQCQRFLRYVVEHSRQGQDEVLRERNIGIEVFGRRPDYDTADDPVVRVRATEVRKRLAQYQAESASPDDVRFEIPSGSYRAEFHFPPEPSSEAIPGLARKPKHRLLRIAPVAALAVVVPIIVVLTRRSAPPPGPVDQFWAPVLASDKPVLLYCGQPVVYFLSGEVQKRYRRTLPPGKRRGAYPVTLDPKDSILGSDVIPVIDQFVGIGNAHTAALLTALLASKGKSVEIRYANDLSFSDLRRSPSVLIGAFSNLWTLEMQDKLRFVFEQDEDIRRIRDRSNDRIWRLSDLAPDGKTPEDYAVVSRLFNSGTGQVLISAAGITQYGTRAAGEFLTTSTLLKEALAGAPADWPRKNIQVLLRTTVYRGTPATPTVVASQVW
jgi:hypothetical protein